MSYRVVYGETIPAWEQSFTSLREAKAFAKKHESFGDVIFSIGKVLPGQEPQSLAAAIDAEINASAAIRRRRRRDAA
jgi:hypothetical protein